MPRLPLVCACLLAAAACSKPKGEVAKREKGSPLAVTAVEVRLEPWERSIRLVGTMVANQEARIAAEVEGSIESTAIEVGDTVEAGRELAQIDTDSYQGMVNLQSANVAKAQANAENMAENLARLEKLKQTGSVSPTDYDQAVAGNKQAQAEVNAAKATLGAATTSLRRSLARAPFAGSISERLVNAGDFVRPGTVMFHLTDDSVLRFRGEVPEREAAKIKSGQLVRLHVDAYRDRTFEGHVSWINPAVNPATRSIGIEALVENPDRALKANFFARAELVVDEAAPTLVVPIEALVTFAGVNKVFVVEEGAAQAREVELGATRGELQEILSGVKAGERVIVSGRTKVQSGTPVTLASN